MFIEVLLLIFSALYFVEYALFYYGAYLSRNVPRVPHKTYAPTISIIIAARNEEKDISYCISSLISQSYDKNKTEIILINDESEDNTLPIMKKFQQESSVIKIVNVVPEVSHLKGKARALAQGLDIASGEIILITDADCVAHKDWAKSIVEFANQGVDIVAGFSVIKNKDVFSSVQQLDWIHLQTMSSAGMALNRPLGIIGNNFSFRKKCYDAIGGYRNIPFTVTEDFALFEQMRKQNFSAIYPCLVEATIFTQPCKTVVNVMKQKHRWSRGGRKMELHGYLVLAIAFFMMLSFVVAPFVSTKMWLTVWLIKFTSDFLLMFPTLGRLRLLGQMKYFFLFEFYFIAQAFVVPILLTQKAVVWKGRVYES